MSASDPATSPNDEPALAPLLTASLPRAAEKTILRLAESARLKRLRVGDRVFDQGETLPLTLILSGFSAYRRTTVDGRHVIIRISRPGELHGLGSATDAASAIALVALTPSMVATWPAGTLRQLVAQDSGLAVDVIDIVVNRVNRFTETLDEFVYQDARQRVLRVLTRDRDLFFGEPPIVSRSLLPSVVGFSREMTSRVIRGLERDGILARSGGNLALLAPDRLERAAAND